MKKFFFFAAAVATALTVNAASFVGFDGRDGTLGFQIHDEGLIQDQVNVTLVETDADAHKYSIQNTESGEMSFTMGGILFKGSDQNAKKDIYKSYGTYIQPNGARRSVIIPTVAGEKVAIGVASDVTFAVEGAEEGSLVDFVAWGGEKEILNTLTATGSEIVLWSDDRADSPNAAKFKLGYVRPAALQGVENVNAAVKAEKRFENGQLVIIKNGVKYNALGAQF